MGRGMYFAQTFLYLHLHRKSTTGLQWLTRVCSVCPPSSAPQTLQARQGSGSPGDPTVYLNCLKRTFNAEIIGFL